MFSLPVAFTDGTRMPELGVTKPVEDVIFVFHEIQLLLKVVNTSKAAGPDGLPNALLKSCVHYITP